MYHIQPWCTIFVFQHSPGISCSMRERESQREREREQGGPQLTAKIELSPVWDTYGIGTHPTFCLPTNEGHKSNMPTNDVINYFSQCMQCPKPVMIQFLPTGERERLEKVGALYHSRRIPSNSSPSTLTCIPPPRRRRKETGGFESAAQISLMMIGGREGRGGPSIQYRPSIPDVSISRARHMECKRYVRPQLIYTPRHTAAYRRLVIQC